MAEYATSIDIDAAPADVFDFLVTEAGMTAWMGQHAILDPRVGGGFAVDIAGYAIRGRYLDVERPRRVVVSWGVAASPDLPPGASTVAFTLAPTGDGTRVDRLHTDLPDARLDGSRRRMEALPVAAARRRSRRRRRPRRLGVDRGTHQPKPTIVREYPMTQTSASPALDRSWPTTGHGRAATSTGP
jgi:uncharacterized protein YndB with AHSA1/START domain